MKFHVADFYREVVVLFKFWFGWEEPSDHCALDSTYLRYRAYERSNHHIVAQIIAIPVLLMRISHHVLNPCVAFKFSSTLISLLSTTGMTNLMI